MFVPASEPDPGADSGTEWLAGLEPEADPDADQSVDQEAGPLCGPDPAVGDFVLLEGDPSEEDRAFMARLVASETATLNVLAESDGSGGRVGLWPVAERLARRAYAGEALTRTGQAWTLREVHALFEQVVADQAEVDGGVSDKALEFAADEVAAALTVSRRTAQIRVDDALAMVRDCPRTLALLQAGVLAYPAARALAREVGLAREQVRAEAESRVLDQLGAGHLEGLGRFSDRRLVEARHFESEALWAVGVHATRSRVLDLVRQVVVDLTGEIAEQPVPALAVADVEAFPTRPGRMHLGGELSEADGCAGLAHIHARARLLRQVDGETRGMGELRLQAFRDLLLGQAPPRRRRDGGPGDGGPGDGGSDGGSSGGEPSEPGSLAIHVHLSVDAAGRVADSRYGPVQPAALTALLAAADASGGAVQVKRVSPRPCPGRHHDLATRPDRHDPSPALAAAVRMRDRRCRFPGCTIPAGRCDLDHTLPWPHGPTCECNLGALCRHHHRLKTHGRWKVVNHGHGHLTWTTPTGRTINTPPDR